MNLDDFADYKISVEGNHSLDLTLTVRHGNCPDYWVERIELEPPLRETNLKWLMLQATQHHTENHS